MKEKTAMQMLFDLIDSEVVRLSKVKGEHKNVSEQCANQLVILKMKSKHLLQKEQEQIEKAFTYGCFFHDENKQQSARHYYQFKYGGEDVDR